MEPMYKVSKVPIYGLDKKSEPTILVDKAKSPYMKNMIVELSTVRKRRGYSQLGGNLPLSGIGMRLINYTDARGFKHLIALTTTKAYSYNTSTGDWDDITPVAGSFTGDSSNRWSSCIATDTNKFSNNGGDALIVSNDLDDIQYYEGDSGDKFETLVHGYPSFANCKEIVEFWNHFMILNFNDGNNNIRSLAYADLGDIDDWSGGTSGANRLTDSRGGILRAVKLGSNLVIYSEESITICRYIGSTSIFAFPTLLHEIGLLSETSLWASSNIHMFCSSDQKIYAYYGETHIKPIGEVIEDSLFDELNFSNKHLMTTGLDAGRHKVMFCFPRSSDAYAKAAYVYNYRRSEESWEYYEFNDSIRSISQFNNQFAWHCDESPWSTRYCDEHVLYCDDSYGETGFPMAIFIDDAGYVYQIDEASGQDDDANIECIIDTPEFAVDYEETMGRWQWFSFIAKSDVSGASVNVYYSDDSGDTWNELTESPVSLNASWTTHRLVLDVLSRRIRYRISQNSSKDLKLRGHYKTKVIPQSERD